MNEACQHLHPNREKRGSTWEYYCGDCGVLLEAPKETGFICAKWCKRLEGPMHARRTLVLRCDMPEGHLGRHCDQVLLVSFDDKSCDPDCFPRNEWNDESTLAWRTTRA